MKAKFDTKQKGTLPVSIHATGVQWLVTGGGKECFDIVSSLLHHSPEASVLIISSDYDDTLIKMVDGAPNLRLENRTHDSKDIAACSLMVVCTGNPFLDERIKREAALLNKLVCLPGVPHLSDFSIDAKISTPSSNTFNWTRLSQKLILFFALMVVGHLVFSYAPLPPVKEIISDLKPYFDARFFLFVLAGFIAQMVDGVLSMGYGVTSATCLMSMGVPPVSVSAAIHTAEVFTTGVSGYSHYRFGNVNKKLFRHLVIPGVIGAILGALMLVFLGEEGGRWLMPLMAVYAFFLGLKILIKAFQKTPKNNKVKRVGWLAGAGGFLDSFGGGGWGPIVTSTLIAKGKSPKYTVGTVSLTEFFVTMASAMTFFIAVGITHLNVVLGLLVGGVIAAPFAAKLAGKLPRKTMMIAVGVMVMIWCVRMIVKSIA